MTSLAPTARGPDDEALLRLAEDVCSAVEADDFASANELALVLQTTVRQRVADSLADTVETANLLSILQYVSERQQHALRLSSRKKRDVVREMRQVRRAAQGVSIYLNHVR